MKNFEENFYLGRGFTNQKQIEGGKMNYPRYIMTVSELSAYLHIDRDTVLRWCRIPKNRFAFRPPGGKRYLIRTDNFDDWFNSNLN